MDPDGEAAIVNQLLSSSPGMVTVVKETGTVTFQSSVIKRILGFEPDELVGKNVLEVIHQAEIDEVRKLLDDCTNVPGIEQSATYRMQDASGQWRWILSIGIHHGANSAIDGIVLTSYDAVRLQPRAPYSQRILESVNDGVVIIENGVITYVNEQITEITGFREVELRGERFERFVAEEDRSLVRERYDGRLSGDTPVRIYEIHLLNNCGHPIPVELSVSTLENADSTVAVIVRDIRHRISQTRQLRVIDRTLRHNLRNAMTTVRGNAEYIRRKVTDVENEAKAIIRQIDQLMNFAEKERNVIEILCERPEPTAVDVGRVCEQCVSDVADTHPEVEITADIEHPAIANAILDIERAIDELLDNAIRHNDGRPAVEVLVENHDDVVQICICDNGPKIPDFETHAITHEYEKDPINHESGLGLWLVYWVVLQSGGSLHFEENEPRGSVVVIELERSSQ